MTDYNELIEKQIKDFVAEDRRAEEMREADVDSLVEFGEKFTKHMHERLADWLSDDGLRDLMLEEFNELLYE